MPKEETTETAASVAAEPTTEAALAERDAAAAKAKEKPAPVKSEPAKVEPQSSPKEISAAFRHQQKLRKQERELQERGARMEAEHQRNTQAYRQAAEELRSLRAEMEEAKRDPLGWAQKHGAEPEKAIKGYIEGSTPEALVDKLQKNFDERVRGLEERERAMAQREQQRAEYAAVSGLAGAIAQDTKGFQYLNIMYSSEEIAGQIATIHEDAKRQGVSYTGKDVAKYLEGRAKARYDEARRREQRLAGTESEEDPLGSGPQANANGNGHQATRGPGTQAGRILAGKAGTERRSPPRQLTEEEKDEANLAALRDALHKDSQRA